MTRLVDLDNLSRRDVILIRETFEAILRVAEGGIQLGLLPAVSADEEPFVRDEKMPDGSRRWLTVPEAAPVIGLPEAYLYKNCIRLRIGRKVGGRIFIDATKL